MNGAQKHIKRCKALRKQKELVAKQQAQAKALAREAAANGYHPREWERLQLLRQMLS